MHKSKPDETAGNPDASERQLRMAEAASGIATFEHNLQERRWNWSPQAVRLFGYGPEEAGEAPTGWEKKVFGDDLLKIIAAPGR